jgi:transglutaminase-like putative cysteine protease
MEATVKSVPGGTSAITETACSETDKTAQSESDYPETEPTNGISVTNLTSASLTAGATNTVTQAHTVATRTTAVRTTAAATTSPSPVQEPRPPIVRLPVASGTRTKVGDKSVIDYSNLSDGYIMIRYTGGNSRLIVWITGPNGRLYQYEPPADGSWRAFPLSVGNGRYKIQIHEGVAGSDNVFTVEDFDVDVSIGNPLTPFLMANYYVDFTHGSSLVNTASQLSGGKNEVEIISAVYYWFVNNITYDFDRSRAAASGQLPGYVPNLSHLMRDRKGICFDYASGMAAMLRSQGIATRVEIGDVKNPGGGEDIYHAWISSYTTQTGWVNWIRFDGNQWVLMEPTWAARNGDDNETFRSFVRNRSNYKTLFMY